MDIVWQRTTPQSQYFQYNNENSYLPLPQFGRDDNVRGLVYPPPPPPHCAILTKQTPTKEEYIAGGN